MFIPIALSYDFDITKCIKDCQFWILYVNSRAARRLFFTLPQCPLKRYISITYRSFVTKLAYPRSFSSFSIATNNPSLSDSRNPFGNASVTLPLGFRVTDMRVAG